ncbi:protein kinase [Herbidospora sp. NEAU-GS84]|uniref:non-specific serine/threonine protein kinase n=1 Tax=Herbidospora solisilvae TaxID=2696284 RepID=A0A7C9JAZ3_9ACTN|nr:serine/threonine-protein kinase [Herbidospora solisilvae]NAS21341.1 protein kinase [Herbidospora solisilvae]
MTLLAGRYRLAEPLGKGGAGTVWRAHDELLRREVAVKQMRTPSDLGPGELAEYTSRAIGEARAAGRLNHPSIVKIHDVVPHEGAPWIVMDLVPGTSLDKLLPLPSARVAEIGLAILDALELAHAHGILHRDVKPANVLVGDDGRAMLADFGIAAPFGADPADSSGSPAYMAPERFRGLPAGPPSDLWSLGATLYAAVEGRGPFHRNLPAAVVAAVVMHDPPPMTQATPALARAVGALLAKDPAHRPPAATTRHLLRDAVAAVPPRSRRTGRWAIGAALTLALGVGGGWAASRFAAGPDDVPARFTAAPDACTSLTTAQITRLLGVQANAEPTPDGGCRWINRSGGAEVVVGYRLTTGAAPARPDGAENLTGVADEAYVAPADGGATVWFRRSNLSAQVTYKSPGDDTRERARQAAQLVAAGIG